MARIDKVTMVVRAPAGTALTGLKAVKIDAGGSVIYSGTADAIGVVCIPGTISAGRPCSVLVRGEIVEAGLGSGSVVYAMTGGGTIGYTAGGSRIGFTVEGDRLVVTM
jgi:hypothetical protein